MPKSVKVLFFFDGTGGDQDYYRAMETQSWIPLSVPPAPSAADNIFEQRPLSFHAPSQFFAEDTVRVYLSGSTFAKVGGGIPGVGNLGLFPNLAVGVENLLKHFKEKSTKKNDTSPETASIAADDASEASHEPNPACELDLASLKACFGEAVTIVKPASLQEENTVRPACIGLIGFSRGAVSTFMAAKALNSKEVTREIPVDIFADQPVPGNFVNYPGSNGYAGSDLSQCENIRSCHISLGCYHTQKLRSHERLFYKQLVPTLPPSTDCSIEYIPLHQHAVNHFTNATLLKKIAEKNTLSGYFKSTDGLAPKAAFNRAWKERLALCSDGFIPSTLQRQPHYQGTKQNKQPPTVDPDLLAHMKAVLQEEYEARKTAYSDLFKEFEDCNLEEDLFNNQNALLCLYRVLYEAKQLIDGISEKLPTDCKKYQNLSYGSFNDFHKILFRSVPSEKFISHTFFSTLACLKKSLKPSEEADPREIAKAKEGVLAAYKTALTTAANILEKEANLSMDRKAIIRQFANAVVKFVALCLFPISLLVYSLTSTHRNPFNFFSTTRTTRNLHAGIEVLGIGAKSELGTVNKIRSGY